MSRPPGSPQVAVARFDGRLETEDRLVRLVDGGESAPTKAVLRQFGQPRGDTGLSGNNCSCLLFLHLPFDVELAAHL